MKYVDRRQNTSDFKITTNLFHFFRFFTSRSPMGWGKTVPTRAFGVPRDGQPPKYVAQVQQVVDCGFVILPEKSIIVHQLQVKWIRTTLFANIRKKKGSWSLWRIALGFLQGAECINVLRRTGRSIRSFQSCDQSRVLSMWKKNEPLHVTKKIHFLFFQENPLPIKEVDFDDKR